MREFAGFSQEEFFQWIKMQLEKREIWVGQRSEKETIKKELYEILFYEHGMTAEEIEYYFVPFGQAGYLTPRQKFEIILFIMEKEYGNGYIFWEGTEKYGVITVEDIEALYLQWAIEDRLYLSEEEKKEFFIQNITDFLGLGILEVLKRAAPSGILIGELCPSFYEEEEVNERIAICSEGTVIRLPFLALENKEELIRIIKYVIALENKGELTMIEPIMDFVRDDGTCITAVRPPAGKDWGIRILYGAARKDNRGWKS